MGKFGRRLLEFIYLCPKLCWRLAGVSFYGPCSTWRAGYLDQVILLVWPKLLTTQFLEVRQYQRGYANYFVSADTRIKFEA